MLQTITKLIRLRKKDWFSLYHLLLHMMSGMARVVSYITTPMITFQNAGYRRFASEKIKTGIR
jgi:hypothetical protein